MSIKVKSLTEVPLQHTATTTKYPSLLFKGTFNPQDATSIPSTAGDGYLVAVTSGTLSGLTYNVNDWLISVNGVYSKFAYSELTSLGSFSPNSPRYVPGELPMALDSTINDRYIASKSGILDGVSYVKLDTVVSFGTEWLTVPTHNPPNEQAVPTPCFTYNAGSYEGFFLEAGAFGYLNKVPYNVGDYAIAVAGKWYKVTIGSLVNRGSFTPMTSGYSNDLYIDIPITTNDYYKASVAGTLDGFSYAVNDVIVRNTASTWSPLSLSKGAELIMRSSLDFTYPSGPSASNAMMTFNAPEDGKLNGVAVSSGDYAVAVDKVNGSGIYEWLIFGPYMMVNQGTFSAVEIGSGAKFIGLGYSPQEYLECSRWGTLNGVSWSVGDTLFYLGPNASRPEDWVRIPTSTAPINMNSSNILSKPTAPPAYTHFWRVPVDGKMGTVLYSAGDLIVKSSGIKIPGGKLNYKGEVEYGFGSIDGRPVGDRYWRWVYSGTTKLFTMGGAAAKGGSIGDWYGCGGSQGYDGLIWMNLNGTDFSIYSNTGGTAQGMVQCDLLATLILDYPASSTNDGKYGVVIEAGELAGVPYMTGDIALGEGNIWTRIPYANSTNRGSFDPIWLETCRVKGGYIPIGASDWDIYDCSASGTVAGYSLDASKWDGLVFIEPLYRWVKVQGLPTDMRGTRKFFYLPEDHPNRYLVAGEASTLDGVSYATGDYAMSFNGVWNKITPSKMVSKGNFSPIDVAGASTLPTINIGATESNVYISTGAGYLNGQAYMTGDRATFNHGRWVRIPDADHKSGTMLNPVTKLDYTATDYANGYIVVKEAGNLDGVPYLVGDIAVSVKGKWIKVRPSLCVDKGNFDPTIPRRSLLGLPNPLTIPDRSYYIATEDGACLGTYYLQGDTVYTDSGTYYRLNTASASRIYSDRVNGVYDSLGVSTEHLSTEVSKYYPSRFEYTTGYIRPPLVYTYLEQPAHTAETQLNSSVRPVKAGIHDILGRPFKLVAVRDDDPSEGAMVLKATSTRMLTGGLWGTQSEDATIPVNTVSLESLCLYTYKDKYQTKVIKTSLDVHSEDISVQATAYHGTNNIPGFRSPRDRLTYLSEAPTLATLPVVTLDMRYWHYHDKLASINDETYCTLTPKRALYVARGFKLSKISAPEVTGATSTSSGKPFTADRTTVFSDLRLASLPASIPPLASISREKYRQVIETLVYVDTLNSSAQPSIVDRLKHFMKFSRGKLESSVVDIEAASETERPSRFRYLVHKGVLSAMGGFDIATSVGKIRGGLGVTDKGHFRSVIADALIDTAPLTLRLDKPWISRHYRDIEVNALMYQGATSTSHRQRLVRPERLRGTSISIDPSTTTIVKTSRLDGYTYRYKPVQVSGLMSPASTSTSGRGKRLPVGIHERVLKGVNTSIDGTASMLVRAPKTFTFRGRVVAEMSTDYVTTTIALSAFLRAWRGNTVTYIGLVTPIGFGSDVSTAPTRGAYKYREVEVRDVKDTLITASTYKVKSNHIWSAKVQQVYGTSAGDSTEATTTSMLTRFRLHYMSISGIADISEASLIDSVRHEVRYKTLRNDADGCIVTFSGTTSTNDVRFTGDTSVRGIASGDEDKSPASTIVYRLPSLPPRSIAIRDITVCSFEYEGITSVVSDKCRYGAYRARGDIDGIVSNPLVPLGDISRYGRYTFRGGADGADIDSASTAEQLPSSKRWICHVVKYDTDFVPEDSALSDAEVMTPARKRWVSHAVKYDMNTVAEDEILTVTGKVSRCQMVDAVRYQTWNFRISTAEDDITIAAQVEHQRILYAATFYLPYSNDSFEFWS